MSTSITNVITRRRLLVANGIAAAMWSTGALNAQTRYPSKPITFVVPFAAGGGTDVLARIVSKSIESILGQPVIIENRPGAGGGVGVAHVARSEPDGYTFVLGTTATQTRNEFLYSKLPYKPASDFEAVTILLAVDNALCVPVNSPFKTIDALVQHAKRNPGKLSYGIVAVGSSAHLAAEMLQRSAKFEALGIPYNSQVTGMTDLIAGRLDFMFDSIGNTLPHVRGGKLRALATTALERSSFYPDVPTVHETVVPNFVAPGWVGLFAPKNTPPEILNTIANAVKTAYMTEKSLDGVRATGLDLVTNSPSEFATYVIEERARWGKVIKEAGIKLD